MVGQRARKTDYQEIDVASGIRRNKIEVTELISLRNVQIRELNAARTPLIFVTPQTQQTPRCQTTPSTKGLIYHSAKASIF